MQNGIVHRDIVRNILVTTIFLGFDRRAPLMFETVIIGGRGQWEVRCATWEQAHKQHAQALRQARAWTATAEYDT